MADVIYSPGSQVGPGWSSGNGPGQSGPSPIESGDSSNGPAGVIYAPGAHQGGSSSYIDKLNREERELIENTGISNAYQAFDIDDFFDNYSKWADNYLEKYQKWNEEQASKAREWEEKMSNTAIQRQMEDMMKAGINPILAGRYGGASYNAVSAPYMNISPSNALSAFGSAGSSIFASELQASTARYNTDKITDTDKQIAYMANCNAQIIADMNNTARRELELSLEDEKFKHQYDLLDKTLTDDLTRYAKEHEYKVDIQNLLHNNVLSEQDNKFFNDWLASIANSPQTLQGQLVQNLNQMQRFGKSDVAVEILNSKFHGVLNLLH